MRYAAPPFQCHRSPKPYSPTVQTIRRVTGSTMNEVLTLDLDGFVADSLPRNALRDGREGHRLVSGPPPTHGIVVMGNDLVVSGADLR